VIGKRGALAVAAAALAIGPAAADAAGPLSYQGYTSQGHEISFKRSRAGVFSMRIAVRASCKDDQGRDQGDYDFTLRALDKIADAVRHGSFTVKLAGDRKTPDATIKGKVNKRGVARGTITAVGRVTQPTDIGTCRSATVHWTAGP
jgi:hypothetical protein